MAGILDTKAPPKSGGIFGMFQDDPEAIAGSRASGRSPLTGDQKRALIFSGIADAIDTLQGRDGNTTESLSNQYALDYTKQKDTQRRAAANKAIADAYATGDMNAVRNAILSADPADVSHIHDAIGMTTPKVENFGGAGYSFDPLTGRPTQIIAPPPKAPLMQGGLQSNDNGKTWAPIPGYVGQQQLIAGARRAPPKPPAGPAGVIALPHPGSQY